jgi:hypothetical protein
MSAGGGVLDCTSANRTHDCVGMRKPTRNEILAEYYLRAAGVAALWIGVAAVWIGADGHVGAQDVASIENKPGRAAPSIAASAAPILSSHIASTSGRRRSTIHRHCQAQDRADRGGVGFTPRTPLPSIELAALAK